MPTEDSTPSTNGDEAVAERDAGGRKGPASRRLTIAIIAVLAILVLATPRVIHWMHTVSTDDAYVNSYVTFVAPRVMGQVARVRVEDNNRVRKGDVLVELDPEPFRVQAAIKQSAVESAEASLAVAEANVHSLIGQTRGYRFKLEHAIEQVENQVAVLRARVASLDEARATLALAASEFDRAKKLIATRVLSKEEFDQKQKALDVARAQASQALESVNQERVALGLPRRTAEDASLGSVPEDLSQQFSSVRQALGELMQSAAQLGVTPSSYDLTPKQIVEEFYRRDPGGDIDKVYAKLIQTAPGLKQAQGKLDEARRDLDQANLDLRYCTVTAEIDGVIARRSVNPGNHVQVGQSLMTIRSLHDIWVDANFKETQLQRLRIGQHVELKVDMYGRKQKFEGRISGLTIGTGSTLALLAPQNATGNFVKVVQRLPVRIEVLNYNPEQSPLFVGLSVEPEVDISSSPSGPSAGKFLQDGAFATPVSER